MTQSGSTPLTAPTGRAEPTVTRSLTRRSRISRTRMHRSFDRSVRRLVPLELKPLVGLVLGTLAIAVLIVVFPDYAPLMMLVVPLAIGSLVLGPRHLPWFVVYVLAILVVLVPLQPEMLPRTTVTITVIFALGFLLLMVSFRRTSLGVAGLRGELMLVDLRDRILRQGGIPALPAEWYATTEVRSAGGTPFAGDFVVASRAGDRLDVAVVDVSGKGEGAGTRALQLSGAMGGLLSALPPEAFLAAANDYLLRQDWDEGFATAVHLTVDLATGDYAVRTAGHPPAARFHSGSGRWTVEETEGPVLGLVEAATFAAAAGSMRPGDALMLYTDGMVETPDRDISLGIDRMLGQAERLLQDGFENGATKLVQSLGSRNDDRALLILHRR